MSTINDILNFWFEHVDDKTLIDKNISPFNKWFSKNHLDGKDWTKGHNYSHRHPTCHFDSLVTNSIIYFSCSSYCMASMGYMASYRHHLYMCSILYDCGYTLVLDK